MRVLMGAVLVCLIVGCSTVQQKTPKTWSELFTPDVAAVRSDDCSDYGMERVDRDLIRVTRLAGEVKDLDAEMTEMRGRLTVRPTPYLTEEQNAEVELLLLRFTHVRDSLHDILDYYRGCRSSNPDIHTKGSVLGMSAGLTLSALDARFVALFFGQKDATRLINARHPRYEIPAGLYDRVYDTVTAPRNLELIDLAWHLFLEDLNDPKSGLVKLQQADPVYAGLIAGLHGLYANTHIQTDYVLYAKRHGIKDLGNRMHHSKLQSKMSDLAGALGKDKYKARGMIFKNVARIKNPESHLVQFSKEQVAQIKALLQPGDIVLTYTAGYMSNVFLPGSFKHGITYIGTVEDRRRAGLTDEVLTQRAITKHQGEELLKRVRVVKTDLGDEVDVIEAVSEGVIMNSLEHLLATHVNRMVVLRPHITAEERLDQLMAVFQYLGAEYDFKFDFTDDTYQCCTELVYRTINGKGSIEFSLVKTKGRWILDADGIARYAARTNAKSFDFVLLAEQSPVKDNYNAVIHTGTEGEKRLRELITPPE